MLNELARELGLPDIAKSPEPQRIWLLLDALRRAQALLIRDNLDQAVALATLADFARRNPLLAHTANSSASRSHPDLPARRCSCAGQKRAQPGDARR